MKKSLILLFLLTIMIPSYVSGQETFRPRYSETLAQGAYEQIVKPSLADVAIAQFKKTMASNITATIANSLPKVTKGYETLTPKQANEKYKIGDLEFHEPISENIAKDLYDRKFDELRNKEIIRLGPKGITTEIVRFFAFICALIFDPLILLTIFLFIFYFKGRTSIYKLNLAKEISDEDNGSEPTSIVTLFIISVLVIFIIFIFAVVEDNPNPPLQNFKQVDNQLDPNAGIQKSIDEKPIIEKESIETERNLDMTIYLSAKDFHKTLQERGVQGVILHSDECYKNIAISNKDPTYCIAFDTLASYTIQSIERMENFPPTPYFENSLYQERVRWQLMEMGIINQNKQDNIISYLKYATRKAHTQIMANE